ncbi:MAG TPA: peptidase T, partial [Oligoflexales bacterium]|nr:peptidase T [Oligoflexales bacterium]
MRTSLNPQDRMDLLERFLRYVKIDTQSDENSTTSPSTEKQKDLSRILAQELLELGCEDAHMNEWGYVFATVEANPPDLAEIVPTIGLIAHVDTAFGASGANVKPQIIERYSGGDIPLPGAVDQIITVAENPNL